MNEQLKELEEKISYHFQDKHLLAQALTHSSYANEHRLDHNHCNERLEFLGDAVLEIVTSDFLYHKYTEIYSTKLFHQYYRILTKSAIGCSKLHMGRQFSLIYL